MNKTYRCLTCGFALVVDADDPRPLADINSWHHSAELSDVADKTTCPSCAGYLKKFGGRKNGKIEMPDIATPGLLQDESNPAVRAAREDLDKDFHELVSRRAVGKLTALRQKYGSNKIYGFSVDDLIARHDKVKTV